MPAFDSSRVRGLLIDLDGVLYVGNQLITGAAEAISELKRRGFFCRFCTNTTTRSLKSLYQKLIALGIPIEPDELFGVLKAAQLYLRRHPDPVCKLLLTANPATDFSEFKQSETDATHIIVGDTGKTWDYYLLNQCFNLMMQGAELVALHKGKYWQTEDGLTVDIGAFVAGLEYVTGRQATVMGKPSAEFFRLALEDLNLPAESVAMLGDDIGSDIGGAQEVGMQGVLVRTGKYREELIRESEIQPDTIVDSVADLPGLLSES